VDTKLTVQFIHLPGIEEYQHDEGKNGTLLGKPETERVATEYDIVQQWSKQNAETERDDEPYDQAANQKPQISFPVLCAITRWSHLLSDNNNELYFFRYYPDFTRNRNKI